MYPQQSRGFTTIDYIIGSDTGTRSEKRTQSFKHYDNYADSCTKPLQSRHRFDNDCECLETICSNFSLGQDRTQANKIHLHSDIEILKLRGTSSISNHTDSSRSSNYSNTDIREGIHSGSLSDTLTQLTEYFIQNSKVRSELGTPLGLLENPGPLTPFRHPQAVVTMTEYPLNMSMGLHVHPVLMNEVRELRHMYPYVVLRYPENHMTRYGMSVMSGLYFQSYRKPKRIQTAFSLSQLLQLERSFEKSHYVVGQERIQIANELHLTETQVKVWFQNRRTKHKKAKSELDGEPSRDRHEAKPSFSDSKSESDVSDMEDIVDVGVKYFAAQMYHHMIQTC